jgi:hypothetical protein
MKNRLCVVALGALSLVAMLSPGAAAVAPAPSSSDVVARVRQYVTAYRPRLAELVAEETYTQQELSDVDSMRVLVSDFGVVQADDGMWVGFWDVRKVNGRELPDRELRAERLFGSGRLDWTSARRIIQESARFNLDGRVRDFNTPIAGLELLTESRSWCCRVKARSVRGANADGRWLLELEETQRPTLVRTVDGEPAYAKGEFLVDPASGAITQFELTVGRPEPITLRVTFARDPALEMWLPAWMWESFRLEGGQAQGHARYSRWRRFQASSRIIGG